MSNPDLFGVMSKKSSVKAESEKMSERQGSQRYSAPPSEKSLVEKPQSAKVSEKRIEEHEIDQPQIDHTRSKTADNLGQYDFQAQPEYGRNDEKQMLKTDPIDIPLPHER